MESQKKLGAILGYVYIGLQSIVSLIYIPLLLDGIGKSEYGIYQIVGSIIAYFSAMEASMCASILKYYVEYKVKEDSRNMENVLAIGRRIFWVLSVVAVLISIPVVFLIKISYASTFTSAELTESMWMFALMVVNLIVNMNNYVYLAAINGHERFVFIKVSSILILIIQPIIVYLIILHYHYAIAIVAVQCVLNVIMAYVRKYYAVRKLNCRVVYHGFDKPLFKAMLALTCATIGVAVADQIFWRTDQLILGVMIGPDAVTEYSIGSQLNTMYISVACVLGGVILPTVTKILVNGNADDLSHYFSKIGRYQSILIVLLLTGVIAFGREFIYLLAGDGYEISYYVALLLMFPYSIDLIQICGTTILQAQNKYGHRARMMMISSILNIGLTIVLIKMMGLLGAAVSTACAIVLGNGFYLNYIYKKKVGLDIKQFFNSIKAPWIIGLVILIVSIPLKAISISNLYVEFFVQVSIYILVYAMLIYLFALTPSEKLNIKLRLLRR